MTDKLRSLFNKYAHIISYLFFGVVTTAVNFLVYWPLFNYLQWSATLSNAVAWTAAVAVAYLTNKPFVFKSHDWSMKVVVPELAKFVGCRIASGAFETLVLGLTVDILLLNGNVMKLIMSVAVVILNYIGSKLLVFTKKQ